MKPLAVFTGDLIGSSDAAPDRVERAMAAIAETADNLVPLLGVESLRFTRFRGDGWQVLIGPPENIFRAATMFLADLRAANVDIETRMGIGIGDVASRGTRDLSDARGGAFIRSGHALDDMDPQDRIFIDSPDDPAAPWAEAALQTLAFLARRWSKEQAEAISLRMLKPEEPLMALAQHFNISRQAFSDRLSSAGYRPIEANLAAFEEYR